MAARIRLRRTGTTKRPSYRVVMADQRSPRDGRFVELLGYYNPLTDPPVLKIDTEKAAAWLKKGALPSNTVRHLLVRAGVRVTG
jgi:small subunit ribosomal protein S16